MSDYPERVFLREEGPREGFQIHPTVISTEKKLALIKALSETGIQSIEVTSFVRPSRVPQMADAEKLVSNLEAKEGVRYRALYLNKRGFDRAIECKEKLALEGSVHISASETFLQKNSNRTLLEVMDTLPSWVNAFQKEGLRFERLMVSTAFGDSDEGRIPAQTTRAIVEEAVNRIKDSGSELEEITLADTTGYGNPDSVKRLVNEIRNAHPDIIVGLHLHDTRGTGMANVYAGLQEGVSRFDCSVAGLGGCPFTKGAAGNVPTEDVAFLCEELGIETGVCLEKYIACAKLAEKIVGHPLPGKLKESGL